ncbi:Reverse transcriptase [Arachis hypogaea]|nr:Reverse transcriptase [Arachis hypogaea]
MNVFMLKMIPLKHLLLQLLFVVFVFVLVSVLVLVLRPLNSPPRVSPPHQPHLPIHITPAVLTTEASLIYLPHLCRRHHHSSSLVVLTDSVRTTGDDDEKDEKDEEEEEENDDYDDMSESTSETSDDETETDTEESNKEKTSFEEITKFLLSSSKVSRRGAKSELNWWPPSPGWVKLNVDGSVVETNAMSGCGGLLRSETGQWLLGFSIRSDSTNVLEVELGALRMGLVLALGPGASKSMLRNGLCSSALSLSVF